MRRCLYRQWREQVSGAEAQFVVGCNARAYLRSKSNDTARATATANTEVLHCVQDEGEKQTTASATATATARTDTGVSPLRCAPVEMTKVCRGQVVVLVDGDLTDSDGF